MSLAKFYTGLALVQTGLMLYWISRGSAGAVFISAVGLISLGVLYVLAKRRLRKWDEYCQVVLTGLGEARDS